MAKDDKGKKKKLKIPKSVKELRWDPKKYAKKHGIELKGKGMSKKRKKEAKKALLKSYSNSAIKNLDKAVKILSDHPDESKKIMKVREAVENVLMNPGVMEKIAKLYKKDPKQYPNLIFLPYMITNTLLYYQQEGLSEEEKADAEKLDQTALLEFCDKLLKKQISHYRNAGLPDNVAFEMANVIPTTKLFKSSRVWYRNLIRKLYAVAEVSAIDVPTVLKAVRTVDKKKSIDKKAFLKGFFMEFILTKSSNKSHTYNDTQKELHENLIEAALEYMDGLKDKHLREMLRDYIKRRKSAEKYKNDTRRVIKFVDYANSNSKFTNLKSTIQDLIAANSSNELYLS